MPDFRVFATTGKIGHELVIEAPDQLEAILQFAVILGSNRKLGTGSVHTITAALVVPPEEH